MYKKACSIKHHSDFLKLKVRVMMWNVELGDVNKNASFECWDLYITFVWLVEMPRKGLRGDVRGDVIRKRPLNTNLRGI